MKKLLLSAFALFAAVAVNAQTEIGFADSQDFQDVINNNDGVVDESCVLHDGDYITWGTGADTWKAGGMSATFNINGVDYASNGAVGSNNPSMSKTSGGVSQGAPTSGAYYTFNAKSDGYLYICAKLNTNKNYVVFEDGTRIPYYWAGADNLGEMGIVLSYDLSTMSDMLDANGYISDDVTVDKPNVYCSAAGQCDASYSADCQAGVIKFPVKAGSTYIFCGTGTKCAVGLYYFDTTGDAVITYTDSDAGIVYAVLAGGEGGNVGGTTHEYTVDPASGSTVEALESITIGCEDGFYWSWNGTITATKNGVAYALNITDDDLIEGEGVGANGDPSTLTIKLNITEAGEYVITIPEGYFIVGTEYDNSEEIVLNYTVSVKGGNDDGGSTDVGDTEIGWADSQDFQDVIELGGVVDESCVLHDGNYITWGVGADTWKAGGMSATYNINGEDYSAANGAVGSNNPVMTTTSGNVKQGAPESGAYYTFDAKANGYLYICAKLNTNKNYLVYEDGTRIPYYWAAADNLAEMGTVLSYDLSTMSDMLDANGYINDASEIQKPNVYCGAAGQCATNYSADCQAGVIKFPVKAGHTYIFCGTGTKCAVGLYYFDTTGKTTITYTDEDSGIKYTILAGEEGSNGSGTTHEYTADPASGSTVETLESITIGCEDGFYWSWNGTITATKDGEAYELNITDDDLIEGEGVGANGDPSTLTINLNITEAGKYVIVIPEGYFIVGTEADNSEQIILNYTVGEESGNDDNNGGSTEIGDTEIGFADSQEFASVITTNSGVVEESCVLHDGNYITWGVGADTWKNSGISTTFNINGVDYKSNGATGSNNPVMTSTTGGVSQGAPTSGAYFTFDAKADGYLYICAKINTNKNYVVFENGTRIPYLFAAADNLSEMGTVLSYDLSTMSDMLDGNGYISDDVTVDKPNVYCAAAGQCDEGYSADCQASVFKFPVQAGSTYIFCGTGTKCAVGCYLFDTTGNSTITYTDSDAGITYNILVGSEGSNGGTTGINSVTLNTTVGNNVYYNLNGQRVSTPTKGVYILNGKKVLVK
ncbi:MAG: hypothetical protein LUC91_01500 [Prevotella sp.]|nr:hypothetical protein [Prevotella sp.]